MGFWPQQTRS